MTLPVKLLKQSIEEEEYNEHRSLKDKRDAFARRLASLKKW